MPVSISSAASARAVRPLLALPCVSGVRAASTMHREPFRPSGMHEDVQEVRTRKPEPNHFTTRPELVTILETLQKALRDSEAKLRQQYILPLPRGLPKVPAPKHRWIPRERLAFTMRRDSDYRQLTGTLGALVRMGQIATLSNAHDVAQHLQEVIRPFKANAIPRGAEGEAGAAASEDGADAAAPAAASSQGTSSAGGAGGAAAPMSAEDKKLLIKGWRVQKNREDRLDEFGRVYSIGRRKTSTARVWIVPTQSQRNVVDAQERFMAAQKHLQSTQARATAAAAQDATTEEHRVELQTQADEAAAALEEARETYEQIRDSTGPPASEIVINHRPLPEVFGQIEDREKILRPFRVTGLLGAYNVFALVRGGGSTGQKDAISLAIARALRIIKPDTRNQLFNVGLLRRDPRIVERKKTNLAKARKAYAWVKR